MPNWASTSYVFKGANEKQAQDLYDKIDSLSKMKEPVEPNGFGLSWMGCLVILLGGDIDKVYSRGEIIDYNLNGDLVSFDCETAWDEMPEFRHFVEQQYPGSKIYYQVSECGNCVYATNDLEGLYFPDRYCIDSYDGGLEYFETIEEVASYLSDIKKDLKPDFAEIEQAIDDYMEEHDNDEKYWMSLHKFDVVDD